MELKAFCLFLKLGDRVYQSLGIGMRGIVEDLPYVSLLYMRPAYITATRSHILATMPKSWVMNMMATPFRPVDLLRV